MKLDNIRKINDCVYEIPRDYKKGMIVPARIYATEEILNTMEQSQLQ